MIRALVLSSALAAAPLFAQSVPAAIYTDPPHDAANPAGMEVIHVPVGGVALNGVVYTAAGAGPHPTLVLLHGLPGNEQNLDLAQAVRRAGWTVVTFNYRGSWGSPGRFAFAGNLDDAKAVLAYVRAPANAARLRIDPRRIVLAGHSMGGWVTAMTAERDPALAGAILISAANMGLHRDRGAMLELAEENSETLATTTGAMADEIVAHATDFDWTPGAAGLARRPLLVLTADDGLAPEATALAARARAVPGAAVTEIHVATDHGWSDARIRLESEVMRWLAALPPAERK